MPPGLSELEGEETALGDAADAEADGVCTEAVCDEQPQTKANAATAMLNLIGT
ncbi:MAG TPA: hypothetical protein VN906_11070 [Candidatus Sulfotelmatobacter sp.]|nr:hypothetical protein [Candidatus Sulfotelmatobacter sp.]